MSSIINCWLLSSEMYYLSLINVKWAVWLLINVKWAVFHLYWCWEQVYIRYNESDKIWPQDEPTHCWFHWHKKKKEILDSQNILPWNRSSSFSKGYCNSQLSQGLLTIAVWCCTTYNVSFSRVVPQEIYISPAGDLTYIV